MQASSFSQASQIIAKYQSRMKILAKQRQQAYQFIKDFTNKHRYLMNSQQRVHEQKKIKPNQDLQSNVKQLENTVQITDKQQLKKAVLVQSGLSDRNKRVIGGLNNHLKKAQNKLKSQTDKTREKSLLVERMIQKQKQQIETLRQRKKQQYETQLAKWVQKKQQSHRQMWATQNLILKAEYGNHHKIIVDNFIMTQSEPKILWKPGQSNKSTEKMLEKSQNQNNLINKMIFECIDKSTQKYDLAAERRQNQKQYNNNLLVHYLKMKQNFIITKCQPKLLWSANTKNNQKIQQAQKESDEFQEKEYQTKIIESNEIKEKKIQDENQQPALQHQIQVDHSD